MLRKTIQSNVMHFIELDLFNHTILSRISYTPEEN